MKYLFAKSIAVCILSFFSAAFVWAQDSEQQQQIENDTLKMYISNAQYRQAIEFISGKEPTKDLLYQKVLCYKFLNNYSSAIEILDTLSEKYPQSIAYYREYRLCLFNYQSSLTDDEAVNEVETKLTALDEYIKSLMIEGEKSINLVAKDSVVTEK